MDIQRCKGAIDLLPKQTENFRFIESIFRQSCDQWGYQEVRTPTLEYLHLFTASGTLTPNTLRKVYSFLDWDGWSGERVVLRPDGTIPVVRLFAENFSKKKMARLYYVTNVFSFESTGTQNRERWQYGVELIGDNEPNADIETILLAIELLHKVGIKDVRIDLSHAGLIKALLDEMQLTPEIKAGLLTKLRDGNWEALKRLRDNTYPSNVASLITDLQGQSSTFLRNIKALPRLPLKVKRELDQLLDVTMILDSLNVKYHIDLTSASEFEYYTGLCYQFTVNTLKLGSGGRYDDLAPLVGKIISPACGFAIYMDPLLDLVTSRSPYADYQRVVMLTTNTIPEIVAACHKAANLIRGNGYLVEMGHSSNHNNRWIIKTDDGRTFLITDRKNKSDTKTDSVDGILKLLGSQK